MVTPGSVVPAGMPCQPIVQPPSWLGMESAFGPVTTILWVAAPNGSTPLLLRSSTSDSVAALRARSLSAPSTAASALAGSTYGCSNSPSRNFNVNTRPTASSSRRREISPRSTAALAAWWNSRSSGGTMAMSTPALTAAATAPV